MVPNRIDCIMDYSECLPGSHSLRGGSRYLIVESKSRIHESIYFRFLVVERSFFPSTCMRCAFSVGSRACVVCSFEKIADIFIASQSISIRLTWAQNQGNPIHVELMRNATTNKINQLISSWQPINVSRKQNDRETVKRTMWGWHWLLIGSVPEPNTNRLDARIQTPHNFIHKESIRKFHRTLLARVFPFRTIT